MSADPTKMLGAGSTSDLGALEDSVVPPYLTRTKAYSFKMQRRMVEGLMTPRMKGRRTSIGQSRAGTPAPTVVDGVEGGGAPSTAGGVAK